MTVYRAFPVLYHLKLSPVRVICLFLPLLIPCVPAFQDTFWGIRSMIMGDASNHSDWAFQAFVNNKDILQVTGTGESWGLRLPSWISSPFETWDCGRSQS